MYTNVSKPTGASYINIAKPTGASYTNINKPSGGYGAFQWQEMQIAWLDANGDWTTYYTNISKPA